MQDSTFAHTVKTTKAKSSKPKSNANPNSKPKPKPKPKPKAISMIVNEDDHIAPVQCKESNPSIYREFYQPRSSILRSAVVLTNWEGSGIFFTNYMNRNYLPRMRKQLADIRVLAYLSRPGQSIQTQMKGVCDVLLLAILNNRPFKCSSFSSLFTRRLRQSPPAAFLRHRSPQPHLPRQSPRFWYSKNTPFFKTQNAAEFSSLRSAEFRPSQTSSISPKPRRAFRTETNSTNSTRVPWESPRRARNSRGFSRTRCI